MKQAKSQRDWELKEDSTSYWIYLDEYKLEILQFKAKQIEYLQNLQNYSNQGIEIKRYFSDILQISNLKIHKFNVLVLKDVSFRTRLQVAHEIDLILLA